MSNLKFAKTYNLVAFLDKPEESDGFEGIIDFLNVSSIRYALTVNLTIYTSCIKQFWATVRRALQLKDVEGTECLPNATIFEQLTLIGAKTTAWNEFSSTMASVVICLAINKKFNFSKYIFDNMVKNLEGGIKFLMYPRATPLFQTMMVQAQEEGEGSVMPTVPQHTPTINPPSTSKPQKKQSRRKQRKDTEVSQPSNPIEPMTDETENVESVPTHSNDPLFSGEDRLQLKELLELCTKLSERVLDLENTKTSQAAEITKLKERVKKLERRNKSRTPGLKRFWKI
ncbi:hypothetical protein Tco_0515052 [Tanacetum coccineum]